MSRFDSELLSLREHFRGKKCSVPNVTISEKICVVASQYGMRLQDEDIVHAQIAIVQLLLEKHSKVLTHADIHLVRQLRRTDVELCIREWAASEDERSVNEIVTLAVVGMVLPFVKKRSSKQQPLDSQCCC